MEIALLIHSLIYQTHIYMCVCVCQKEVVVWLFIFIFISGKLQRYRTFRLFLLIIVA